MFKRSVPLVCRTHRPRWISARTTAFFGYSSSFLIRRNDRMVGRERHLTQSPYPQPCVQHVRRQISARTMVRHLEPVHRIGDDMPIPKAA